MTGSPSLSPPADITAARLQIFAPQSDYMALAPRLDAAAKAQAIVTPRRVRHFMAQMHVESLGFTRFSEGLYYTTALRLCEVWPTRFPDVASATPYLRNPEKLANQVYGGRMGNTAPGDGFLYRGRGLMQLTGRANYDAASKWSGLDLVGHPDMAADPGPAAQIAASFWNAHGCNQIADADPNVDAGVSIANLIDSALRAETRIVNGGETGLSDRQRQLMRASTIWVG
jgi:putative chitinase